MNAQQQEKLYQLVDRLLAGTSQGAIKWTETADEDSFRALLKSGLVRVERLRASRSVLSEEPVDPVLPSDDFGYLLLVLDDKNKEIGRLYSVGPKLGLLWEQARDSALNTEQKINSILEEVGNRVVKQRASS